MMWYISHLIFAFTVIHKPWLLSTFENADVSQRKKWKLVSFATARRNKTDIIEIELLRYTAWRSFKRSDFSRYANLMRFWTETNFGLYIAISHKFFYSWRWLWVSTRVSFTITIIIERFSARRIKKGSICSHIARTNIYFETHSMQIQIQCNALWTKNNLRKKIAILL